ncbi:TPA: RNA polymerase subunit sigma [Candidatus Sumerlaeota bacterium]|jgi:NAD-dependent deacetylase|nr:RNA polymerase subunit sigma [Candidatus Sumerlaeota bacterium]
MNQYQTTADLIKKARRVTAFTGAGISAESGIPPFRGENGLWNQYDPQSLEIDWFQRHPAESWRVIHEIFYSAFAKAKPNPAHLTLAEFERRGILKTIITQNIDNLHFEAGSQNVLEFHGNSRELICLECGNRILAEKMDLQKLPPLCKICGGLLKPDFVFFGEMIPEPTQTLSFKETELSDLFLLIGTTGAVMPAALIPQQAKRNGATIVEINPEESSYTRAITDVFIQNKAGESMQEILKAFDLLS